jgi:hypothetical protein
MNEQSYRSAKDAMDTYFGVKSDPEAEMDIGAAEEQLARDQINAPQRVPLSRYSDIASAMGKKGFTKRAPLRELIRSWICRLLRGRIVSLCRTKW